MNLPKIETNPAKLRAALGSTPLAVFDFETSGVKPHDATVAGLGVFIPDLNRAFYVNVGHTHRDLRFPTYTTTELKDAVQPFFWEQNRIAVFHNATYDIRIFFRIGVAIKCRTCCTLIHTHRTDENLRSFGTDPTYHLNSSTVSYGLKELTTVFYGEKPSKLHETIGGTNTIHAPVDDVARYCIYDVLNTYRLYERARVIFHKNKTLESLVSDIDNPNNLVLSKMLWEGIGIDQDECFRQKAELEGAIQACRETIWQSLDYHKPLETPRELKEAIHVVAKREGMVTEPNERLLNNEIEEISTTREILTNVLRACNFENNRAAIAAIIQKQTLQHRITAFLNPTIDHIRYTKDRLYANRFDSTLITTRFSSSPNLQNLPKRSEKEDDELDDLLPEAAKVGIRK